MTIKCLAMTGVNAPETKFLNLSESRRRVLWRLQVAVRKSSAAHLLPVSISKLALIFVGVVAATLCSVFFGPIE